MSNPSASLTGRDSDPPVAGGLQIAEATELAHALTHRVLAANGIRALFIKGPIAGEQELRARRVSNDVDVLIDPAAARAAVAALDGLGWSRYHGVGTDMAAIAMHATTYCIPGWPCTVDVHAHFPGLLAPAQDSFDVLWSRRATVRLAHQSIPAPAREDHQLLLMLHPLRDVPARSEATLHAMLGEGWNRLTAAEQDRLVATARATGALEPIRSTLSALGRDVGPVDERFATAYRLWELGRSSLGDPGVVWRTRWQALPWRRRPELLVRAFWDISLDSSHTVEEWAAAGPFTRGRGRLVRAGRGLRAIPGALRAGRRGAGPSPRR